MSHTRPHHHLRGHRERGATLIEFAFVVPFLLLVAFGTAEMGMAWVSNNRAEGSVATAARVGASSGAVQEADLSILQSVKSSLPQELLDNLDRVVVFRSATADGSVPSGCIKAVASLDQTGVNGQCNSYAGETVKGTLPADLGTLDDYWSPTSRNDNLSNPPDYIGVWIRTSHNAKTGTFFDDMTIVKASVYRIQPDVDG